MILSTEIFKKVSLDLFLRSALVFCVKQKFFEKSKTHVIGVFGLELEIIATTSISTSATINSRHAEDEKIDLNNADGYSVYMNNRKLLLFLSLPEITHNTIAHECRHIVNFVLYSCAMVESHDSEYSCWIAGHVAELVYSDLKSWKIKVI